MSGEKEKRAKELLWDKDSNPKKQSVSGELDRVQCPGSPIVAASEGEKTCFTRIIL